MDKRDYIMISVRHLPTFIPPWSVYGHVAPGDNDCAGEFETYEEALVFAHTFDLPVVRGGVSGEKHAATLLALGGW